MKQIYSNNYKQQPYNKKPRESNPKQLTCKQYQPVCSNRQTIKTK